MSIDVGIKAYAGLYVGVGADVHYRIGLKDDPGGFDWSAGIKKGGTGAYVKVYGAGNAEGTLVVK